MRIKLDLVDEFQQQFGQQFAFEKARDFMFEYISQIRSTLPPVAATAWEIVKKSRAGIVTPQERDQTIRHMWDYVNQCEAAGKRESPESGVTRALFFLLNGPGEEYVSEDLHWSFILLTSSKIIRMSQRSFSAKSLLRSQVTEIRAKQRLRADVLLVYRDSRQAEAFRFLETVIDCRNISITRFDP
jgi:hypothetical protein